MEESYLKDLNNGRALLVESDGFRKYVRGILEPYAPVFANLATDMEDHVDNFATAFGNLSEVAYKADINAAVGNFLLRTIIPRQLEAFSEKLGGAK